MSQIPFSNSICRSDTDTLLHKTMGGNEIQRCFPRGHHHLPLQKKANQKPRIHKVAYNVTADSLKPIRTLKVSFWSNHDQGHHFGGGGAGRGGGGQLPSPRLKLPPSPGLNLPPTSPPAPKNNNSWFSIIPTESQMCHHFNITFSYILCVFLLLFFM